MQAYLEEVSQTLPGPNDSSHRQPGNGRPPSGQIFSMETRPRGPDPAAGSKRILPKVCSTSATAEERPEPTVPPVKHLAMGNDTRHTGQDKICSMHNVAKGVVKTNASAKPSLRSGRPLAPSPSDTSSFKPSLRSGKPLAPSPSATSPSIMITRIIKPLSSWTTRGHLQAEDNEPVAGRHNLVVQDAPAAASKLRSFPTLMTMA